MNIIPFGISNRNQSNLLYNNKHKKGYPMNKTQINLSGLNDRIPFPTTQIILLWAVVFFNFMLLIPDGFGKAPDAGKSDDELIDQYIQSIGSDIITFDASNIKQYWIDLSVINENNKTISIRLPQKISGKYESNALKIQLANVDESQRCTIRVFAETPKTSFWISNSKSKRISSTIDQEDFLQYQVLSTDFQLKDTPDYGFNINFSNRAEESIVIKKIVLSFDHNPARRNIEEWNKSIPELAKNSLILNGDFETLLKGEALEKLRKKYAQQELTPYVDTNRMIPTDWKFDLGSWCKEHIPDMALVADNALAGKYSLLINPSHPSVPASVFSTNILKGNHDCQFCFFVRNDGTEKINLQVRTFSWIPDENKKRLGYDQVFTLNPGTTYRIHDIITLDEIYSDATSFEFCISLTRGRILMDQFSMTNIE